MPNVAERYTKEGALPSTARRPPPANVILAADLKVCTGCCWLYDGLGAGAVVTGFGHVLLGLDNRDLVKRGGCNVSRGHLNRCTRRVGRVRSVKMRVNVIVNNNGVFHKLSKTKGNFSHIGNSRVNVLTAIVGDLKLDSTLMTTNMGTHILATVHVRPVNRFCAG